MKDQTGIVPHAGHSVDVRRHEDGVALSVGTGWAILSVHDARQLAAALTYHAELRPVPAA